MGKRKDLKYYLSLPYTIQITREDESTWFARVVELPSCLTEGDSPGEVVKVALPTEAEQSGSAHDRIGVRHQVRLT